MSKLKHLITGIKRENKIPSDELMQIILDAVETADEDMAKDIYVDVYEKAYGETLTREVAEEWVRSLPVSDGSPRENGQKWNIDQTYEVGNKIGVDWQKMSKIDWYIVLNMEYAKHYHTAKNYGNEADPLWFAHIARDEWCDSKKSLFQYYIDDVL